MANATAETTDLDQRYQQTIDSQKAYLARLQTAFDQHCDSVSEETKAKLTEVPEDDEEARKKLMDAEQEQFKQALAELNQEIKRSSAETYKKLEQIDQKRVASSMDLEAELSQVANPKITKSK